MKERHKVTILGPEGEKEYWSDTPIPKIVEEQNPYSTCTEEELRVLLRDAERLEENDGITLTKTIIRIERALEAKEDSGIIYQSGR